MTPMQVLERYHDALLAGDLDTMRESFAEDATWTLHGDLPISGPWHGRDSIIDDFLVTVGGEIFEPGTPTFDWISHIADVGMDTRCWALLSQTLLRRLQCVRSARVEDKRPALLGKRLSRLTRRKGERGE